MRRPQQPYLLHQGAADDTRVAVAKLERLVIGNANRVTFQSGNNVATLKAAPPTAWIK